MAAGFTAALLSGVFLILFGLARLGRFIVYIPHTLLSGFFTAAGIVPVVVQVLPAIGHSPAADGVIGGVKAWTATTVQYDALAVAGMTVAVGLLWPSRLARYAPGQFVALLVGSAAGILWFSGRCSIRRSLPPAFTMALLCSTVTLLTCLQADASTGGRHHPNRELIAQGVGNIGAGLIGGNPGGASSTTFVNLQAGGRSKAAGNRRSHDWVRLALENIFSMER